MKSQKRKLTLTVMVIIFTLMSTFILNIAAKTYLEVARATQGMEAKLEDVEMKENTIFFTFRFNNESNLDITLVNVQFNLYSDRTFIGNYSMREKTVLSTGDTDILVTAEIDPYYVKKVIGHEFDSIQSFAAAVHEVHWFIQGAAVIELPFEGATVNVRITELWVIE